MTEPDSQARLRSLGDSLRRIRSLLAWEQLKQSEARPDKPPAFRMSDPTEADLRNEYSFFLSTSVEMHRLVNNSAAIIRRREQIRQKLAEIEREFRSLCLQDRFF